MKIIRDDTYSCQLSNKNEATLTHPEMISSSYNTVSSLPLEIFLSIYDSLYLKDSWSARQASRSFYYSFKESAHQRRLHDSALIITKCANECFQSKYSSRDVILNPFSLLLFTNNPRTIVGYFESDLCLDKRHVIIKEAEEMTPFYSFFPSLKQQLDYFFLQNKLRWRVEICISKSILNTVSEKYFSRIEVAYYLTANTVKLFSDILRTGCAIINSTYSAISRSVDMRLASSQIQTAFSQFSTNLSCYEVDQNEDRLSHRLRHMMAEVYEQGGISLKFVCDELASNFQPMTIYGVPLEKEYSEDQEFFIRCLFGQDTLRPISLKSYEPLEDGGDNTLAEEVYKELIAEFNRLDTSCKP